MQSLHEDPDRVRRPLLRTPSGFKEVSWDEAFAEIDRRLTPILAEHGRDAVGSYLGKVEVARGAQQTDGEQSVKAMLLDRGATANCKPELEIFADDVKCAHGASVGELDAMQLFYAESRGLDPASARALLLEGFVMGLWESVSDEAQRDRIASAAHDALRAVV